MKDQVADVLRLMIATHLSEKSEAIKIALEEHGTARVLALCQDKAAQATRDRQMAVAKGANAFGDPRWLCPEIPENRANTCASLLQGQISETPTRAVEVVIAELPNIAANASH
ncbi:MAG: hypothetical protein MUC37_06880 [Hyphomicrobium sp.]|nr:hypothetical protein [Hyphomicrobium sp.]